MISTSLEPFPNQHGVFFWTAPTKIPCPIEIWILYVESKACHCPVSVKVSGFTRFFRHWEQDSLFNAFRDSRNCLEGSDFNGQAMDKQSDAHGTKSVENWCRPSSFSIVFATTQRGNVATATAWLWKVRWKNHRTLPVGKSTEFLEIYHWLMPLQEYCNNLTSEWE